MASANRELVYSVPLERGKMQDTFALGGNWIHPYPAVVEDDVARRGNCTPPGEGDLGHNCHNIIVRADAGDERAADPDVDTWNGKAKKISLARDKLQVCE
jgi:hypothetical protein